MKFYNIKDSYIEYLKSYDDKVSENKNEKRPYVGIVLQVGATNYFAPFSSPKPKHIKMKNTKDFRKIDGGRLGAINFNNMIPVPESALILMKIDGISDTKYQRLLRNQAHAISADETAIKHTAEKLHGLIFADENSLSENDKRIKSRCCNLPLLEKIYRGYTY